MLRIIAELQRCPKNKVSEVSSRPHTAGLADWWQIIWFLAPTVWLCEQQHEVLQSQMPNVCVKMLHGDAVETWSEQRIWDAALLNVRVVVSTYRILLDALYHAFVKIDSLALIVLDEGNAPLCPQPPL